MGLFDGAIAAARDLTYRVFEPKVTEFGSVKDMLSGALRSGFEFQGGDLTVESITNIAKMSAFDLWSTQPYLRTVVSFRARNTAQLGLHVFERVSDTDRKRDRGSVLAKLLKRPNPWSTGYEMIFSLIGDLDLYDTAYWQLVPPGDSHDDHWLVRIPPAWVTPIKENAFWNKAYKVLAPGQGSVEIPATSMLVFSGYNPTDPRAGSPTLESLRDIIQEQLYSTQYRRQTWARGGRVSSVLTRPVSAPKWSDEARKQFREDWYASYTGNGANAGGTPILSDGMDLKRLDLGARDQQWYEGAKLALNTVAAAFHVNPTMVGALEQTNYSNVKEFRKMLYGETLGPILAQVEARINTFLLPMLDMGDEFYAEFNVAEKLQGDFEAQTQALQSSVGRPWRTANEARALQNLPALDGGDDLVVPLNVLIGGQASPRDADSTKPKAVSSGPAVKVKARPKVRSEEWEPKYIQVLSKFFRRQSSAVRSRLGAKADADWWDGDRWDGELANDLTKLGLATSSDSALKMLASAGIDPEAYDVPRTHNWIEAVTQKDAKNINETTRQKILAALEADERDEELDKVFNELEPDGGRLEAMALGMVTTMSAFGVMEAGQQTGAATKTWVVTSGNPRPSHAAMDGETVRLSEDFSNGMPWPGSPAGDADELAGCTCELQLNW